LEQLVDAVAVLDDAAREREREREYARLADRESMTAQV